MTAFAPFLSSLWNSIEAYPQAQWRSALSYGQLKSKEWLIENAHSTFPNTAFPTAFVIGGWYGVLPALWKQHPQCPVQKFRSIDIDDSCRSIAESVNKKWVMDDWQFKATTADALAINYRQPQITVQKANGDTLTLTDRPSLIINTCCEHFSNLEQWLSLVPSEIPLILQSNNFRDDQQHIGCHSSLAAFEKAAGLKKVLFAGELELEKYSRYMLMGWR